MKKLYMAVALGASILLAGCSTPHTISLKDGSEIETADTPEYNQDSGFWEYETPTGVNKQVNKDEVKQITEHD